MAGQAKKSKKPLNLALQGGGAHGAFCWGVLDRLLEEDRLDIHAACGTSAGAVNAALLMYGLETGGPERAREVMRKFWDSMVRMNPMPPMMTLPSWADPAAKRGGGFEFAPALLMFEMMARVFSPYELNPLNYQPLKLLLEQCIDFEELRKRCPRLYICATNVRTNRLRVFTGPDVCVDAVMASACLPFMFQAVDIDGESYWDGGYMGNPPIFPLIYNTEVSDVLLVMINPINIKETPKTARDILDRINTLSFNSSLMREMRAINFVSKLIDKGFDDNGRLKKLRIHTIDAEAEMGELSVSSKFNTDRRFINWLFELGREHAETFLSDHFETIGVASSTDIETKFL